MDKFRAKVIYTMTWRRMKAGSGEFLEPKHVYYEALRVLEKNGWMNEALEYSLQDDKERRELLKPTEEEFYDYLVSEEPNEARELYFIEELNRYNIDGRIEETIRYKAAHGGEEPSSEELSKILEERRKKDW